MKPLNPGLFGSEDDHQFRSLFIRWLLHNPAENSRQNQKPFTSIPRVLIQYWHDPFAIPADVQECMASWDSLREEGFQRLFFDDRKAHSFIRTHFTANHIEAFEQCYHPAMRC